MIEFEYVKWKNLLSTGNAFTSFDFTAGGTTVVVGSNGSGKSTMLDALSFALYGKPFRKVTKGQLVNSVNGGGAVASCAFKTGGKRYVVTRGLKPALFTVEVDGQPWDAPGNASDQQERLEKSVLKMNHRACMQVVVLGSASYVPFMELPAAHRREVLEDILDLRVLGSMRDVVKARLSSVQTALRESELECARVGERLAIRRSLDEVTVSAREEREKKRAEEEAANRRAVEELWEEGVKVAALLRETQEAAPPDVGLALTEVRTRVAVLADKQSGLAARVKHAEEHESCPLCERPLDGSPALGKMKTELAWVSAEASVALASEVELADQMEKRAANAVAQSDLRTRLSMIKKTIDALEAAAPREADDATVDAIETAAELEESYRVACSKKSDLERLQFLLRGVQSALRDDGVKAEIVGKYVPMINSLINSYLREMDFFVEFELDSSFEEKIRSRYRDEFSYHSFSEGEKMRINLAILFAWREVARARNSASTNLVVMDEIFDSSLDPSGAEDLMRLLTRLTSADSVVIISHRSDQVADKFGRVVKFEKVGNFSVMREEK